MKLMARRGVPVTGNIEHLFNDGEVEAVEIVE